MEEKIIKKETVTYNKSAISKPKGDLVLTPTEIYFSVKKGIVKKIDEKVISISIPNIINVKAKKAFGYGIEHLELLFKEDGKEKKAVFEHISMASWVGGALSRAEALYFADWQKAIEDLREGKGKTSEFNDLEKLSDLKDKGIITKEEFETKKKQILGI